MHELLCTYITPHEKSCCRYIPIDFFECVEIITSIGRKKKTMQL